MKPMRLFYYADDKEIRSGETTDIYFVRTKKILKKKKLDRTSVTAEVTSGSLPNSWPWGVLCGVEEVAKLFQGREVDVYSMPEGTIFYSEDFYGVREPVMYIKGPYGEFCILESPLLGFLCQASGIATKAARIKSAARKKTVISFGVRRMHPSISPMIDRAAYIGGLDAVSSLLGARTIEAKPVGTMPHALIILLGDQIKAWKAFDEVIDSEVPRVALVDTYFDEKIEAIMAAEALKERLFAVRLDTPSSRRGSFPAIVREVRWELDIRGYRNVKIFVSGGLDEETVKVLSAAGADAFGVGTAVSNAPTVDFAMDIVSVEGKPVAKRGKLGGEKQVWRCPNCLTDVIRQRKQSPPKCPKCNKEMIDMLKPLILNGEIMVDLPKPKEIRGYVLQQLEKICDLD